MGAKNGILFKNATALENTGKTEIMALDKTGTITLGQPVVTDVIPADGVTEAELMTLAYSLEKRSEHPLARAAGWAASTESSPAVSPPYITAESFVRENQAL